jgi:hypothetical protein
MSKKIVPKKYQRSLEEIIRENPKMTGEELLAEQGYERACYKLYEDNKEASNLELIDKILKERYYKFKYKSSNGLTVFAYIESAKVNGASLVVISGTKSVISCSGPSFNLETNQPFTQLYKSMFSGGKHVEITAITEETYNKFFQSVGELFNI